MRAAIRIPKPCAENWNTMTPAATGRHCAACVKTVVDFTEKTDAEILAHLAGAVQGTTCGRFRARQLNRPLHLPANPVVSRWRLSNLLTVGSLVSLLSSKALAQTVVPNDRKASIIRTLGHATQPAFPILKPATKVMPGNPAATAGRVLRGMVQDTQGAVLPGVTVLLQGTTTGVSTNSDGTFELLLPETTAGDAVMVVFSSVGFVSERHQLPPGATELPLPVKLEEDVMGGLGYAIVPPAPWHARAFFGWGKYWLTRPFRH